MRAVAKNMLKLIFALSLTLSHCATVKEKPPEPNVQWQQPLAGSPENELKGIAAFLRAKFYNDLEMIAPADRKFSYEVTDLNQDTEPEYLVIIRGNFFCGKHGCSAFLLDRRYNQISRFWAVTPPVFVLKYKKEGWHSLGMHSDTKSCSHKVSWQNGSYAQKPWEHPCASTKSFTLAEYFTSKKMPEHKF